MFSPYDQHSPACGISAGHSLMECYETYVDLYFIKRKSSMHFYI